MHAKEANNIDSRNGGVIFFASLHLIYVKMLGMHLT